MSAGSEQTKCVCHNLYFNFRLGPLTAPAPLPHTERPLMNLTLQEALLVGNRCDQVTLIHIV